MWRYLVGGVAALLMVAAVMLAMNKGARSVAVLPAAPAALAALGGGQAAEPLPATVPAASERTREQKRFDRYDKDRNGTVTREEYLAARRKAFAKLDVDHDGKLSFDEWAIKAETKFAGADADKTGTLTAAEFATTAVKRKPARRVPCAPTAAPAAEEKEES
ncbi:MAG: EF-hand domain-containing protein [Janthinobacterium lividum]